MRDLPPFDALVAFEAALRLGSMTAAAAELGVTQSAVSHRVRRLEAFVGTALLFRRRSGLAATAAGTALAARLGEIFERMAGLREHSRSALPAERLRVGVGAALANHWLVRRLPSLAARHGGLDIELVVLTTPERPRAADLDLRIGWVSADEARSSSTQRLLFREQVFPVCHPRLLAPATSCEPARLARLPLVHKRSEREHQGLEWEWGTWFEWLGLPGRPGAGLLVADIGTAIAAAIEGAGVVLARSLLVHDALVEGRLARPLPARLALPSGKAHVATWPARLSGDSRVRSVVAWLAGEAEATVAAAAGLAA